MPGNKYDGLGTVYLSVVGGKFRQKVDEHTEGAVRRDYELSNGESGTKWELVYKDWTGVVRDLRRKDSDFGTFLEVVFDDAVLSLSTDRRFFTDFVKKFAGADPKQSVTLSPYDFTDKDGEKVSGMTVTQNGVKLSDFFYDFEKKKSLNGMPEVSAAERKKYDKDDWKAYFIQVKKFLLAYAELTLRPKLDGKKEEEVVIPVINDEVKIDQVPF